ncbi:biotin/lipoyl-containing protein [Mesoterricola silvestris]|uniref:Acetyl-CoA carboxylase biotin carboxyl carrier protein subunit n=1 Tax=Mesoterricola silvestris TaxID=2927979 RepID=A0AA48GR09_9BACT|nr:biotin/lipoyl-containing protein [Mesoterricola silvestris]BDU72437.1 acetyl-CoA carboxylase biotin carboxyl carrier protein subunit [Mesoterricola silvestris]
MKRTLVVADETVELEIYRRRGTTVMTWDGVEVPLDIVKVERSSYSIIMEGRSVGVNIDRIRNPDPDLHGFRAATYDGAYEFTLQDPRKALLAEAMARSKRSEAKLLIALMPGKVLKLLVQPGDIVEEGQPLLILEAMKMQNEYTAPTASRVSAIHVEEGANLEIHAPMISLQNLEPAEGEGPESAPKG